MIASLSVSIILLRCVDITTVKSLPIGRYLAPDRQKHYTGRQGER
jgi:hypothetical protein